MTGAVSPTDETSFRGASTPLDSQNNIPKGAPSLLGAPFGQNYGGDGGSRTHVQNGLKQTSTSVDFVSLAKTQVKSSLLALAKQF